MKRLRFLTLFTITISSLIFFYQKRNTTTIADGDGCVIKRKYLEINKNPLTALKDIRPADQTFLTYPEWYLVFSPEEQANYFKKYTATSFPFMSHTRQIWESYHIVNNQIKNNFPPNKGYHFMIWVIGSSASVEYAIKALYETLIGRITDTYMSISDEDKFNAKFTEDYVNFIKVRPWYEFDFKTRLKNLWTSTTFFNENFLRKIERKYLLTSELMAKWIYGKLIGMGTKQVYEVALPTTVVILNDSSKIELPRYNKFNQAITELATQGKAFKEIAGNNSAILLTVLLPLSQEIKNTRAQIIFTQPIASNNKNKRVALAVPVVQLAELLLQLKKDKILVEHIFDY